MIKIHYKGFEISSACENLVSGGWTIRVLMTSHNTNDTAERFFDAGAIHQSQITAEQYSIEYGMQIIDGKYPELLNALQELKQ